MSYLDRVGAIAAADAARLQQKDVEYGGSWLKRGGVGAYFVMVRKIDRLETQAAKFGFDVFRALADTSSGESLVDTIRDLRGYLLLIEAEHEERTGRELRTAQTNASQDAPAAAAAPGNLVQDQFGASWCFTPRGKGGIRVLHYRQFDSSKWKPYLTTTGAYVDVCSIPRSDLAPDVARVASQLLPDFLFLGAGGPDFSWQCGYLCVRASPKSNWTRLVVGGYKTFATRTHYRHLLSPSHPFLSVADTLLDCYDDVER